MTYSYKTIDSPLGQLKLVASDKGLAAILWKDEDPHRVRLCPLVEDPDNPLLVESVWRALLTIPFGETRSYGQIARQIGKPTAARAVGAANGKNPISIIAPCHRVIGLTGALTGFAGGLAAKERLLGADAPALAGR